MPTEALHFYTPPTFYVFDVTIYIFLYSLFSNYCIKIFNTFAF